MSVAGDVVRYITLFASIVFIIRYIRFPWYRSIEGTILMGFASVITCFLFLIVSVRVFGRYDFYDELSLFFFGVTGTLMIMLNVAFTAANKRYETYHETRSDDGNA